MDVSLMNTSKSFLIRGTAWSIESIRQYSFVCEHMNHRRCLYSSCISRSAIKAFQNEILNWRLKSGWLAANSIERKWRFRSNLPPLKNNLARSSVFAKNSQKKCLKYCTPRATERRGGRREMASNFFGDPACLYFKTFYFAFPLPSWHTAVVQHSCRRPCAHRNWWGSLNVTSAQKTRWVNEKVLHCLRIHIAKDRSNICTIKRGMIHLLIARLISTRIG